MKITFRSFSFHNFEKYRVLKGIWGFSGKISNLIQSANVSSFSETPQTSYHNDPESFPHTPANSSPPPQYLPNSRSDRRREEGGSR